MTFDPYKFIEQVITQMKEQVGDNKVICAMSGGVDSSVLAVLGARALGNNLTAVFVDTGMMRLHEPEQVAELAQKAGINLRLEKAVTLFFEALNNIDDPEEKRKIIGAKFIEVFDKVANDINAEFLLQGTIAPDWIESGGIGRNKIKSHHNVAGLPSGMKLKLCEPLRDLYKHEVRQVARALKLPPEISERQPFPGPGLAIRVVGKITPEKVDIVKRACYIVETELEKAASEKKIERPWQYFAALLPLKTVGVRRNERTYKYTIVIRAVSSLDAMTANFSHLFPELLQKISTRITNEIHEVGRVFYDITDKPPGTIEME